VVTQPAVPSSLLLTCLAEDVARLNALAEEHLTVPVPACPGWTLGDLVRHVANGLLNVALRQVRMPDPAPEEDLTSAEPVAALRRCHAAFAREVGALAGATAYFWLRRMAHETAVHRIDAKVAAGQPVGPIRVDLAVDGVGEALAVFLDHETHAWRAEYQDDLTDWDDRWLLVSAGVAGWRVTVRPDGVRVEPTDEDGATAVVSGAPTALLLWLYGRGDDVVADGDGALVAQIRRLLSAAMS
jgi:uncharacterized protein (TIGR03083 family)